MRCKVTHDKGREIPSIHQSVIHFIDDKFVMMTVFFGDLGYRIFLANSHNDDD